MAISTEKLERELVFEYANGKNAKGEEVIKNQKIGELKLSATEDNIHEVGEAIKKIMGTTVMKLIVKEDLQLISK